MVDYAALKAQALDKGADEEAVTVNTRALIDKVLARYSGEWTTLRELLQNAADASATKVTIKFETIPSTKVPLPQGSDPAALLRHTILHNTLRRLVVTNNGTPFGTNDWSRLKRIAEGNPDETKIGAFGVGFYSVFADCEEPLVSSGKEAMAFYWKANSLFTRRLQLSQEQASNDTTFVLDYRNSTTPVPALLPLAKFLASSLTFVGLTNVELYLDDWRLISLQKLSAPGVEITLPKGIETKTTEGLMKVQSVTRETAQVEAKWLKVVGWKPKAGVSAGTAQPKQSTGSLRTFLSRFANPTGSNSVNERAERAEQESQVAISQDLLGEDKSVVFLQINTAKIATSVPKTFAEELERATKKPPPKVTKLAVLTASYDGSTAEKEADGPNKAIDLAASILPNKSGRVFIGFPTSQTTGLAAHIAAQSVIPTVERESIDLNARWVKTWNMEMLRAAGIVCRLAWMDAIEKVQTDLSDRMRKEGRKKPLPEDIDAVLSHAVHVLNQFTFSESTPSSNIGKFIEEAFWTCRQSGSIEILSSLGVLPSQKVRLGTDDLSFVSWIPIIPKELYKKAHGFVQKLVDYEIITDVTISDIKSELQAMALGEQQVVEFLGWLTHKAQIREIDDAGIKTLLSYAIAQDKGSSNILSLGTVKFFLNPNKIPPEMPLPPDTIPWAYTKSLSNEKLSSLGWTELQILPWLRWLVGQIGHINAEHDMEKSAAFSTSVLATIARAENGLSRSTKESIVDLLSSRPIMPTKLGMKKPGEAYFSSVNLFNDLPFVTVNGVKDKFLSMLGVRKTLELELIFDRLLRSQDGPDGKASWNHIHLINYLGTVLDELPKDDMRKLQTTAFCLPEAKDGVKPPLMRVNELFAPNDDLRALGFPILEWRGELRHISKEGKILDALGLRKYPTEAQIIDVIHKAASASNFLLRDKALRYMIEKFWQNGYSPSSIASTTVPFLPLEGSEKSAVPSECYTNEKVAAMGFNLLKENLRTHQEKFGVKADPPIQEAAQWLINHPPSTARQARESFEYFSTRLNDISTSVAEKLGNALIVPVPGQKAKDSDEKRPVRRLAPKLCFLGASGKYKGIFDYVDFGTAGNLFLLRLGSKTEPSTAEIAALVVREPARVLSSLESPNLYLELLSALALNLPVLQKDKRLMQDMSQARFLLASREQPPAYSATAHEPADDAELDDEDITIKSWELARASEIVLVDDVINYNLFKGAILAAPQEETLEKFYAKLGAKSLASAVHEEPKIGQPLRDQTAARRLQKLVMERIRLFVVDLPTDQLKHDANWMDKNLTFGAVSSITVKKTLIGTYISHTERTAAMSVKNGRAVTLNFTPEGQDSFQISNALVHILLERPKPQLAMILSTLLDTDLNKLRARGYNVDRILRRRAAEARIAEELRKKLYEQEQVETQQKQVANQQKEQAALADSEKSLTEHGKTRRPKSIESPEHHDGNRVPGAFEDSPTNTPSRPPFEHGLKGLLPQSMGGSGSGSFLKNLTRSFGFDDTHDAKPSDGAQEHGHVHNTGGSQTNGTNMIDNPVLAERNLQQNLQRAIRKSRAHESRQVVSDKQINEVKEVSTFCDARPAQNIHAVGNTSHGMRIFLSKHIPNHHSYLAQNQGAMDNFSELLLSIGNVLELPPRSLHIFSEDSATIAFNNNGALFMNYRYFERLHLEEALAGRSDQAMSYWFVTLCHELAHNIVADHSAAHSFYTETFMQKYLLKLAGVVSAKQQTSRRIANDRGFHDPDL